MPSAQDVGRLFARGLPVASAVAPQAAEGVLADLLARIGGKNLALAITRKIPLLGGGVGAVMDGVATHEIGRYARSEFVPRRALQH